MIHVLAPQSYEELAAIGVVIVNIIILWDWYSTRRAK